MPEDKPNPQSQSLIGRTVPRVDARSKASGAEKFAIDAYPDGLLWAGVKRAGVAHGRIRDIHSAAALAVPGVEAVLTAKDVPGTNRQGIVQKDMPVLAEDRVRYAAEAVALVLAESRDALRRGLAVIELDIEPLPAVFDPERALDPDAPRLHERPEGNLLAKTEIICGRGEDALEDARVVVCGVFEVPMQAHAFLETENGAGWVEEDGELVVLASTQAPYRDRLEISHALGLPVERIRVIAPPLGGGFGGKDGVTVQCLLGLAALHSQGRPVKMVWEREESFAAGYKRHAVRMRYALGAAADGRLHCLVCELYYDTGAYAHLGGPVMVMGLEHAAGPYSIPHARLRGYSVYTNNPVAGAMRAFGAVQPAFALERLLDALAARLGLDPLEIRRRNALGQGETNVAGVRIEQPTGMRDCLDLLERHPRWRERQTWIEAAPRFTRRGVGLAAAAHAMGYGRNVPDFAAAKIELTESGGLRLYVGVCDMGQGNATAYAQIAAEILRQAPERIELVWPDTARTLYAGSAAASRTTYTFGNALIKVCEQLRGRLLRRAALLAMRTGVEDFTLEPGLIRDASTGRAIPLAAIAGLMREEERVCVGEHLAPEPATPPPSAADVPFGFPHSRFCYAAHFACVEVDTLTGQLRVDAYVAATAAGRVLNPQAFEQQIQGGVAQGLGYAQSEAVLVEDGIVQSSDFSTYLIPTSLDLPDVESLAANILEPSGPYGLKGVGEIGAIPPLPALANAVAAALGERPGAPLPDAVAARLAVAPLTPERVLLALAQFELEMLLSTQGDYLKTIKLHKSI